MNVLLVSGTHPDTPHISGVRAGRFAVELARLGHRCVLICPAVAGAAARDAGPVGDHDWATPYIAEVDEAAPRDGGKLATAWSLLRHGGKRRVFGRAVVARGRALAADFRPDAGWSTFGTLEGVMALRRLARECRFPWIFDVKDNAEIYVPASLRRPIAHRLKGYSALHANARLHADSARRWLGEPATVLYSGVDPCFFADGAGPVDRYVTLVGSLYRPELVDAFVESVARHNRTRPPLRILHLGTQGGWVASAGARHGVVTQAPGYVTPETMAGLCQRATANAYIFLGRTFHHKLFELLACRRPVIAFGGELPESIAAAAALYAPLHVADDASALASTLAVADQPGYAVDPRMPRRFYTWPEQAAQLDAALRRLVR